MPMRLDEQDRVVVIQCRADECGQLWRTIEMQLDEGKQSFVLDVTGIAFLTSVNIAAIITTRNKVAAAGGRFVLANLTETVKAVFRVLKLERLFALDLDLGRAVGAARI